MVNCNLIEFSKFLPHKQVSIDCEAAKRYFISEVLPYVCVTSVQRLIIANASADTNLIRLEMMRMYVESELTRPSNTNNLKNFFQSPS